MRRHGRDRQTQASNILEASAEKEIRMSPQLENWKNSLKSLYRLLDIYAPSQSSDKKLEELLKNLLNFQDVIVVGWRGSEGVQHKMPSSVSCPLTMPEYPKAGPTLANRVPKQLFH